MYGLYDPRNEHDACGVGLVADISGRNDRAVGIALRTLENMAHRGAENADGSTGDGAGIMVQIPHAFLVSQGTDLPEPGTYGAGMLFISKGSEDGSMETFRNIVRDEGGSIIAEREVPVRSDVPGEMARAGEPKVMQVFISVDNGGLEEKLYRIRTKVSDTLSSIYICSLSSRTMVYKGMLTPGQLRQYYPDLDHPEFRSKVALVHSRFSTNTLPSWKLAQPFRMLCHNGEINTIRGNRSWMRARENAMNAQISVMEKGMSDSASLDNVAEFLVHTGRSMEHTMSMLIPESWNDTNPIPGDLKAFYEYHSILMEPWDGPAAVMFTDGTTAGGMLDRNGLRPARYTVTKDGLFILASETGVVNIPAGDVKEKGRLGPGKMIIVDTVQKKIVRNNDVKEKLASEYPYREWLDRNRIEPEPGAWNNGHVTDTETMRRMFGYGKDDTETIKTMASTGKEPIGSMGNDTQLAIFSDGCPRMFDHFRQSFAQVTNPPIDPIREELVMSITGFAGSADMDISETAEEHCRVVKHRHPVITVRELESIRRLDSKGFRSAEVDMTFPVGSGTKGLVDAVDMMCRQACGAAADGAAYVILSDRSVGPDRVPVPSLLAVSAVHNALIEAGMRIRTSIVVESGEPRNVMHHALLLGHGANLIDPYLALAVVCASGSSDDVEVAERNYIKASEKGILKIISKMGIATLRSYRGASLFEAIGLNTDVTERYFPGTSSNISGITMDMIAEDAVNAHRSAYSENAVDEKQRHSWAPRSVKDLRDAVRNNDAGSYERFRDVQDNGLFFIRDAMEIRRNEGISQEETEPSESILKRFSTGAMSFGSISKEAHETLASAMNAIGGRSNTGEGGEGPERSAGPLRSAIKQIASGRFGVTAEYLVNADEIQIKVAQGAKPGEGGQLMGYKVDDVIARTRHTSPGVTLISPPPHHDIYSIEDLAQLIYDMRSINPNARIGVKLVSENGVGTVAAGVVKAGADVITISGADGGTGASPVSSIRYAGMPWETGLAEAHQTLVLNGLRDRVRLQADGQMKTGRDVIIAALLGADEFSFSTAPMVAMGCIMDRKCHTNGCPVGIATQDPELRKKFKGRPEHVINYFEFVAEDVRRHLAEMGFRNISEIVGRADLISKRKMEGKASTVDISRLTEMIEQRPTYAYGRKEGNGLDRQILNDLEEAPEESVLRYHIRNTDRSVGTMLSGELIRKDSKRQLRVEFTGSAGQSFGAFLVNNVEFKLMGEANDYVGKGLSGGRISLIPDIPDGNVIAGNTILYGATSGEMYIRGKVGERFCVRNSGATAVVEGVGDHGCEYMTGGRVAILGGTGRNFAAGMSGGVAYVLNHNGLEKSCNMEMVNIVSMDDRDAEELRTMLNDHYRHTGSPKAEELLNGKLKDLFVKIVPISC